MLGPRGLLPVGTMVVAVLGGCAQPPSPPPTTAPASLPSGSPVVRSGQPPTPAPTDRQGGDERIDPSTFLQLCDRWPDAVVGEPLACDDLVRAALEGIPAGGAITRVVTSYTCATSCRPLDPSRGFVQVESTTGAVEVEVARQPDGSIAATSTTPFEPPELPAFDAPNASAPVVEGAPGVVNRRHPLPHCGVETRDMGGPFDTPARQCFWDGIRAGSPVEFIDRHPDTEGLEVNTVYRFTGSGAVEMVTNDEGGYWLIHTGIGPATEPGRVFETAGLGDRQLLPDE
jgi:hypothetical protein